MSKEATAKPQKGGGSLVWKITLRQTLRTFWFFVRVNLLIVVLVWAGILYAVERIATELPTASTSGQGRYSENNPLDSYFTVSYQEGVPRGLALHTAFTDRLGLLSGSRRWVAPTENGRANMANSRYQIQHYDTERERTVVISFRPSAVWIWFRNGFWILSAAELLHLLGGLFSIQRSVRKTLRPINELTLAAQQSIYTQTQAPPPEDLHLSGTIDTLNAIDEGRLDTRVPLLDDREELRGLAEAINSMLDRLDSAYRSQLRFVSDASHELRTPISVIQGYANLLDRWGKNDEETLNEAITAIKGEAEGMKDLVEQLLFLARSDNQSIRLQREPFDLSALVHEVARETEMIDHSHSHETRIEEGLRYNGDAGLLKQALRILVDNAVKYTPEGERIQIGAGRENNTLRLWVSDHGVGIAASDLPRLFDRFFRADASRTRQTGGTGLGLSIAKWIVDSHGGHLNVVSREEIGTRISILLSGNLPAGAQFLELPADIETIEAPPPEPRDKSE